MSDVSKTADVARHYADDLQSKWGWFLALGATLVVSGALAVALPAYSTFAASTVLGAVLVVAGIVKIVQSFQVRPWRGFVWQELAGVVELVGGAMILFNPLKGALAITLLIALVFLAQGIMQLGLAIRVRPQGGWGWLLISGLVALAAGAALTLKLQYTKVYTPGTIAGIALLVAGGAYFAMALAIRRARA